MTTTGKACAFVIHFGDRPGWYDLWNVGAQRNPIVDFILVTDMEGVANEGNIRVVACDRDRFNAKTLMGVERLRLSSPYKICDFRPLFGEIFADLTTGYDYWGWCDLDILIGNLEDVLGDSFGHYDYIATGREGASGPLAFLRNRGSVNALWRQIPGVHAKLNDGAHHALDERDFLDLLKREVRCDIEFHECLDDLPARWIDGEIISVRSGRHYALHHFGGRLAHTRAGIVRDRERLLAAMEGGRAIRIGASGRVFVEQPAGVLVDNTLAFLRATKARLRKLA